MKALHLTRVQYVLISILILGAVLRLIGLGFQSPWLDEIHTLTEANPNISLSQLSEVIKSGEQLPPLYFYFMYFWFKCFGYNIFVARLFSAVLGIATLFAAYKLTKKLFNSQVALFTTAILAVNPFLIYHSQEARPYMFYTFFSLLSLYFFITLIKKPSYKNAIYYGLSTVLMLYGQFVGLFILTAQGVYLAYFFFTQQKQVKRKLVKHFFIAYSVVLVLFIPCFSVLKRILSLKDFWIPPPNQDSLQNIFKNFFGNSEAVLFLIFILFIGFCLTLFKIKDHKQNKHFKLESVLLILIWLGIGVLIPLVKSYVSNSIILDRYFIALLPAIVIVIAIGISTIYQKKVQYVLLIFLILFSLSNLFFETKYYTRVSKSQFRETTQYIKKHNNKNHPVVSRLSWYLPYFFQDSSPNFINANLDDYVNKLKQAKKIESFWYFDGHNTDKKISPTALNFLNKHYVIKHNLDAFQAWTNHYVLKTELDVELKFTTDEVKRYLLNAKEVTTNFENFSFENNQIKASGWAFFKNLNPEHTVIEAILFKQDKAVILNKTMINRDDVVEHFKIDTKNPNLGFKINTKVEDLKAGTYNFALLLHNNKTQIKAVVKSNYNITISNL